jgi:chromosome segregation ATPase
MAAQEDAINNVIVLQESPEHIAARLRQEIEAQFNEIDQAIRKSFEYNAQRRERQELQVTQLQDAHDTLTRQNDALSQGIDALVLRIDSCLQQNNASAQRCEGYEHQLTALLRENATLVQRVDALTARLDASLQRGDTLAQRMDARIDATLLTVVTSRQQSAATILAHDYGETPETQPTQPRGYDTADDLPGGMYWTSADNDVATMNCVPVFRMAGDATAYLLETLKPDDDGDPPIMPVGDWCCA